MAACFILFFALNPIYAITSGISAGKDLRTLWALPIITAVFFLAGTWLLFDMGETAFILYALIYLALGMAAMLLSAFITKSKWYTIPVYLLSFPSPDGSKTPRFLLPFDYHWRHWLATSCRILPFPWQSHRLLTTISARQIAAKQGRIRLFRRLIAFDKDPVCVPRQYLP